MISVVQALSLIWVAVAATGVVLTRDPVNQTVAISFYGILLGIMFFVFQAPDVALSQIVIGAVALPLMILLALARIKKNTDQAKSDERKSEEKKSGKRSIFPKAGAERGGES
jgi:uncharacterized MnhB-related membrane protein